MDTVYDWLYTHYCKSYRTHWESLFRDTSPEIQEARELLLSGKGDTLDREDALDLLRHTEGVTSFALGMQFCYHLMTDLPFPRD